MGQECRGSPVSGFNGMQVTANLKQSVYGRGAIVTWKEAGEATPIDTREKAKIEDIRDYRVATR